MINTIGYEIGYRIPKNPGFHPYKTLYVDLPIITDRGSAQSLLNRFKRDFPDAEWRMVEVRDNVTRNLWGGIPLTR